MVRIIYCPLPILWASLYLFFSSGIQSDGKDPGDREKEQFEGRADKENLKEVSYGEIKLDNYDAKTVTYVSNGNYSKEYFIVFKDKIGEWAVGAKLFACLGSDNSYEAKMDELAKTFEVLPEKQ